jgi:predicted molibdopterin-dependent oxidoreductase YjgC
LSDCIRLDAGVVRPPPVHVLVNGQPTACHPGESVAAVLLAAGFGVFRRTASGAARAPFCNMGACFDCVVTVNGRPFVRSCLTAVQAGMRIETVGHE